MNKNISPTVFLMIDGLRPDAITADTSPQLLALQARSSFSLVAESANPSMTLPCHMSIFHSVPPARHGVTTNTWMPMARPLPGVVDVAKTYDRTAVFFYNWEPLRNLSVPGSLAASYFWDTAYNLDGDVVVAETAVSYLRGQRPNFTFIYFGTVDTAGHYFGWMSPEYLAQVNKVDQLLGQVLAQLPADCTILLQSDHGGHERTHGTEMPEDMMIPWLVAGPGIRQGHEIQTAVSLLDTAPTLAKALDIPIHAQWEGKIVSEIYLAD